MQKENRKHLIEILKEYRMLKNVKLLEALTLNYDIFKNVVLYTNEKSKILTLEYRLPHKVESKIVDLMIGCGIKEMDDIMPYDFIETLLYQLSTPIYHSIAKEKGWPLTWVNRHIEHKRGDLLSKDTTIHVKLHPLSLKEKKESIYKSIIDHYIAIKTSKMKDENGIIKFINQTHKGKEEIISTFIKEIKEHKLIDENFNILYTDKAFDKYLKRMARKIADPEDKVTKECGYSKCKKIFLVISKKRKYCSNSCRYMAWRAKKNEKRKA